MTSSIVEINGSLFSYTDVDEYIMSIQMLVNGFSLYASESGGQLLHTYIKNWLVNKWLK